jgi:hypothetical protein
MKITVEYNLPEEIEDLEFAIYGVRWKLVVSQLDNELRQHQKHDVNPEWDTQTILYIRDVIYRLVCDEGLEL